MRAIHAEAQKRGIDHDGLRDICRIRHDVQSVSDMSDAHLMGLYRSWTGKSLKRRAELPRRGADPVADLRMVSGSELEDLAREFAMRGWGPDTQRNFVRRQLKGRETIRTHRDWKRVIVGVRAITRREEAKEAV